MANRTQSRSRGTTRSRSTSARRSSNRGVDEGITAWLGELFSEGPSKRTATRTRRAGTSSKAAGTSSRATSATRSTRSARKLTRSEAGRAGGLAPHRCRGRACSKTASSRSRSSTRYA